MKPKTQSMRETLRKEAQERQAAYDALTLQQKLDKLPPEPHAAKQRAKLLAQTQKPQTRGMGALPPPGWEGLVGKTVEEIDTHFAEKKHGLTAKERRAEEKK